MYIRPEKMAAKQQPDKLGMSKGISPVRSCCYACFCSYYYFGFILSAVAFASVKDKGNLLKKLILFYVYKKKLLAGMTKYFDEILSLDFCARPGEKKQKT